MAQFVFYTILCFLLGYAAGEVSSKGKYLESQTFDSGPLVSRPAEDPDIKRNVSELITSKGYPVEEHTVQTDDGYILTLIRIPHGKDSRDANNGTVLLVHGDTSDAVQWVINFPNESLGFILPDHGYDTWLLNNRGCKYSKKHIKYTTDNYRFWNFSFDELGEFDLPATIDYILDLTGEDSLYVIGHSRGGSQTFAMLSEKPDYNKKVRLFIAMAPATFLSHMTGPVRDLIPAAEALDFGADLLSSGEFSADSPLLRKIEKELCTVVDPEFCEMFIFAIGGADKAQFDEKRLDVYVSHYPSSTSTRSLLHYAQLVRSGKFRKYDFGQTHNLKYYHQEEPPEYNLSNITTPVAVFWSKNDKLVDPRDIDILRNHLNSLVFSHLIPYPYNHFDFAIAKNAPKELYVHVLHCLSQY